MAKERTYAFPNVITPSRPVIFNSEKCTGCNRCVEVCPIDVYVPSRDKGKTPLILHPDECWYCGTCVNECPVPGAVKFNFPLQQKGYWRRKESGEIFRA